MMKLLLCIYLADSRRLNEFKSKMSQARECFVQMFIFSDFVNILLFRKHNKHEQQ